MSIIQLARRYGITFQHSLGQNFLADPEILGNIVEESGITPQSNVLEIGAGMGFLTSLLSSRARRVLTVEADASLKPALNEVLLGKSNVTVLWEDALKADLRGEIQRCWGEEPFCCVANLPYHLTTPILEFLLYQPLPVTGITLMLQKEAALRICAPAGHTDRGVLSVISQYRGSPQICWELPGSAFTPAVRVTSALLHLPVAPWRAQDAEMLSLVKRAFMLRRKTLVNSLCASGFTRAQASELLTRASIPLTARAQELTVEAFVRLLCFIDSL